ncbi:MAG: hypothetical protein GTO40_28095, partial [Deltaproteobacteria bacterium]|nr:hypothetical protein [Deltaproteobacteria bacterium]
MEFKTKDQSPEKLKSLLTAIPVREQGLKDPAIRALDRQLRGRLSERMERSRFSGAAGSTLLFATDGKLPASQLLIIGMGKEHEIESHTWRKAGARTAKEATSQCIQEVDFFLPPFGDPGKVIGPVAEGALLSSYQFQKYRSDDRRPQPLQTFNLVRPGFRRTGETDRSLRLAKDLVPGVFLARDLINEPPSVSTATYLADQALEHCRSQRVKVEVWAKKKIETMNLAGLLAVNRG